MLCKGVVDIGNFLGRTFGCLSSKVKNNRNKI